MKGIYMITNKLTGKSYIGQSVNIEKRFKQHCLNSISMIDKAIQLNGFHNFNFEVIKEIEDNKELGYWEDYYIKKYNTMFPNGYNFKYNTKENIKEYKEEKVRKAEASEYRNNNLIVYNSIFEVLKTIDTSKKGLIFARQICKLKEIEEKCNKLKIKAIAIWSIDNLKYHLTPEQIRVRDYIIENGEIPEEYEAVLLNQVYRGDFNIKSKVDYIIIHDGEKDFQIQARGRYRGDINEMYIYDKPKMHTKPKIDTDIKIVVPECFLNKPLNKEDKKELSLSLRLLGTNSKPYGWCKLKEILIKNNYKIEEKRSNSQRVSYISA